jgi:hypothetical protein
MIIGIIEVVCSVFLVHRCPINNLRFLNCGHYGSYSRCWYCPTSWHPAIGATLRASDRGCDQQQHYFQSPMEAADSIGACRKGTQALIDRFQTCCTWPGSFEVDFCFYCPHWTSYGTLADSQFNNVCSKLMCLVFTLYHLLMHGNMILVFSYATLLYLNLIYDSSFMYRVLAHFLILLGCLCRVHFREDLTARSW